VSPSASGPSFLRGAAQHRASRRAFLRAAGVGVAGLGLAPILAACGVGGNPTAGSATGADQEGAVAWWTKQMQKDLQGTTVNFTNWPQYIDVKKINGQRTYPTLDMFTEATGVDVVYRADVNDIAEYYATIRPSLEAGQYTGADLMVITNGPELSEMINLGYLIALDQNSMTNFRANADPTVVDPSFDPGNMYTMAWQSGFTGIGWNRQAIDREITSFQDLMDPSYAGKVGMIGNNVDLPNLALCAVGVRPETSTPSDWQKAADLLQKQKDQGIVRKYYDQDYLTAMENGDIWISMAWGGDMLIDSLYYGFDFGFVIPKEGGVIWTDNLCIPAHAENPVGAMRLADWYYDPKIAALLTEYNNSVGPVPAAKQLIEQDAAATTGEDKKIYQAVASSPFVFPTPEIAANVHRYRVLTPDEFQQWNDIFSTIYES
jgi:spermidine/putrescine transport system substrate-binding protein